MVGTDGFGLNLQHRIVKKRLLDSKMNAQCTVNNPNYNAFFKTYSKNPILKTYS